MSILIFGCIFSEYINTLRLSYAEKLLKETDMPISNVAYNSGYGDPGYMSKKFKKKNNMSPSTYRKH